MEWFMKSHIVRFLTLVVSAAMIALVGSVGVGAGTATAETNTKTFKMVGKNAAGEQVFTGTFTAKSAKADKSAEKGIALIGDLSGQVTAQPGNPQGQGRGTQDVNKQNLALPINQVQAATCDVLSLVLGPLHLELLGLIVDLNEVHLDITADPAGGLLGQLLCGLAGGPSGGGIPGLPGTIQSVIDLLNQLLGLLG
jgi:hypothetical protein